MEEQSIIKMEDGNAEEFGAKAKLTLEDVQAMPTAKAKKIKLAIMANDFYALANTKAKESGNLAELDKIIAQLRDEYEVFRNERDYNSYVVEVGSGQKLLGGADFWKSMSALTAYISKWNEDHKAINTVRESIGLEPLKVDLGEEQFKLLFDLQILDEWAESQKANNNGVDIWSYRIAEFKRKMEKEESLRKLYNAAIQDYISRAKNLGEQPPATLTNYNGETGLNQNYTLWLNNRRVLLERLNLELRKIRWDALPHQVEAFNDLIKTVKGLNKRADLENILLKIL